jgi:DNA-binding NtrC family response regulator
VDVRVVSSSSRPLEREIAERRFREDLFYRLNVVHLRLPALRERPGDILALADHFARKYAELNGLPSRPIATDARKVLLANGWRGNVRELENTIHRAVLLASGAEIGASAVMTPEGEALGPAAGRDTASRAAQTAEAVTRSLVGNTVADVERELILDTLDHCLGNRTHAAKILGISIRTLRNKLSEYSSAGITVAEPGQTRISAA